MGARRCRFELFVTLRSAALIEERQACDTRVSDLKILARSWRYNNAHTFTHALTSMSGNVIGVSID